MSGLDPSQMSDADKRFKDVQDIGKASFNSLESTLNYGSGLGQYGWKSINAVETILHKYKLEKKQTLSEELEGEINVFLEKVVEDFLRGTNAES